MRRWMIMVPAILIGMPLSVYVGMPTAKERVADRNQRCLATWKQFDLPADKAEVMCDCVAGKQERRGMTGLAPRPEDKATLDIIIGQCASAHGVDVLM